MQLTLNPPSPHVPCLILYRPQSIGATLLARGPDTLLGKGLVTALAIKRLVHTANILAGSQSLFFVPLAGYFGVFLGQA